MAMRWKQPDPIDRAISDLDQRIATVQRQMREVASDPARTTGDRHVGANFRGQAPATAGGLAGFIRSILTPPTDTTEAAKRDRQDLFDVNAEPLKELEAEPIAFAKKAEPDLFAHPPTSANPPITGTAALETAQVVPPKEKLAAYLGAGSIRSYKPLKRAQRQTRNRFFMWLGLSFFALWIIWFVIR
jgi:hypothetical protein